MFKHFLQWLILGSTGIESLQSLKELRTELKLSEENIVRHDKRVALMNDDDFLASCHYEWAECVKHCESLEETEGLYSQILTRRLNKLVPLLNIPFNKTIIMDKSTRKIK